VKRWSIAVVCLLSGVSALCAGEPLELVVAQDGSGQYRSIQAALDAIPPQSGTITTILIKNGTYHEKLLVTKCNIALVGESRDSTRIVYAELRENWRKAHDNSDWGSAVINIDSTVTNLTIANLTVYNNYGALYGSHEHQYAIWGTGTRIIIIECNILGDGGDTVSLWNKTDGMYYHSNCYFEGWVDFVCPRGWCYITDSRFYGHNLSASIWHDGSANRDEKFVMRYCRFDGVPGFPLGRHHRDAQFYLLDCVFSRNMADRPIYAPLNSPNLVPWAWGVRHYFYNCHREGGDYAWFEDNLSSAEGFPIPSEVDAAWSFGGRWNPEAEIPPVLPAVSMPFPRDAAYGVPEGGVTLHWLPVRNAVSHNIFFGKEESPGFVKNQQQAAFQASELSARTTYYWRIDEIAGTDTLRGPVWHFTTK